MSLSRFSFCQRAARGSMRRIAPRRRQAGGQAGHGRAGAGQAAQPAGELRSRARGPAPPSQARPVAVHGRTLAMPQERGHSLLATRARAPRPASPPSGPAPPPRLASRLTAGRCCLCGCRRRPRVGVAGRRWARGERRSAPWHGCGAVPTALRRRVQ